MRKPFGLLSTPPFNILSIKKPVALLAGEGVMPGHILDEIQAASIPVLLLAIRNVTSPRLVERADKVVFLQVTQLGKAIRSCKNYGAEELVFAGRVHHKNLFSISSWKMDWTTFKIFYKLKDKRANSLFLAIVEQFAHAGITVASSVKYLKRFLAKEGVLTKKSPCSSIWKEVHFGVPLAKELGRLDIGQTIVVKNQAVVAVEAMEGTDLCLERAGQIAGEGCVVVKMAKPSQDMRFDVPVVGVNTIEKLAKIGAKALVIEAEQTLLIDPETLSVADQLGVVVIALPKNPTCP